MALLNENEYEGKVRRQLRDESTYVRTENNPFPILVVKLNEKLKWAQEIGLPTKREYEYLFVIKFNVPTSYIIPKILEDSKRPPG